MVLSVPRASRFDPEGGSLLGDAEVWEKKTSCSRASSESGEANSFRPLANPCVFSFFDDEMIISPSVL
jgi:hypothetical protein